MSPTAMAFGVAVAFVCGARTMSAYIDHMHDAYRRRERLAAVWGAASIVSLVTSVVAGATGAADLARVALASCLTALVVVVATSVGGCLPAASPAAVDADAACPCEEAWTAAYVAELRLCPASATLDASRDCRAEVERRYAARFCGRR